MDDATRMLKMMECLLRFVGIFFSFDFVEKDETRSEYGVNGIWNRNMELLLLLRFSCKSIGNPSLVFGWISLKIIVICMKYELNNAFEIIILLFSAKVKNKLYNFEHDKQLAFGWLFIIAFTPSWRVPKRTKQLSTVKVAGLVRALAHSGSLTN